jgi:hypothetical protein
LEHNVEPESIRIEIFSKFNFGAHLWRHFVQWLDFVIEKVINAWVFCMLPILLIVFGLPIHSTLARADCL